MVQSSVVGVGDVIVIVYTLICPTPSHSPLSPYHCGTLHLHKHPARTEINKLSPVRGLRSPLSTI